MCQRMKNRAETPVGKLITNEIPEKMWIYLTVDFITKLLLVVGKNIILVVCDKLFKMAHFVVTIEETLAEGLVRLFRDDVWKLHRLPESIISNRDLLFTAELTRELNKMLGIETRLLMVFHPQTNGQTEWMNQELEQYLRFFTEYRQRDWPEWLATTEFTVKNKIHTVIKVLAFIKNYGRELRMGANIRRKGKVEKATEFAERIKRV